MRTPLLALALCLGLAACAVPPPESYAGGSAERAGTATAIGANSAGEACTQQARGGAGDVDIFCGTWAQPSGHVQRGDAATTDRLAALATSGPWRASLDTRFQCGEPTASSILGGEPALVLKCTRRVGGWPQVAIAASVDGRAYLADSILPVLPVLEQAIAVMAGRARAGGPALARSNADALLASRLAAQSFSAGDVGQYEALMQAGTRANLAESYVAAEEAFRAALALQQKALGHDDPNVAMPLMHVALQVSDQGRGPEAQALFAQAERLAPRASDQTVAARLLHYEALHALNEHRDADALALLQRAEAAYAALLPANALRQTATTAPIVTLARSGANTRADPLPRDDILLDPTQQSALIGVIETRRYRAIVLRELGRDAEAQQAIADAAGLAAARNMRMPQLSARLFRTAATSAGSRGDDAQAASALSLSTAAFGVSLPNTRPHATTLMLQADSLARGGNGEAALARCREAVTQLRDLQAGIAPDLLAPCLAAYAAAAERRPSDRAALAAEMFEAAQLGQSGVTSIQIAQAAARLREAARDPRVGAAIRRRQDAVAKLSVLYGQRDLAAQRARDPNAAGPALQTDTLDADIASGQAALADSDSALQAASPNYGQLVQGVAPAAAVLAALAPHEAFAAIVLSDESGWTFVLHDGRVDFARAEAGLGPMAQRVRRMRAGIEATGDKVPRFDVAAAQQIYDDTLGRLDPSLAGVDRLVVAPSGPLMSIPFAALLTGPGDADRLAAAPWLIRRMSVAHVPAPSNFVALRKAAGTSRATQPWFGLGDSVPVTLVQAQRSFPGAGCADDARLFAGLPRLAFARRELAAARGLLGATPADEMLGADFTVARVQRTDLSQFRVLHFAAHALLPTDLRCQSEPAVVTSDPAGAADASGALLTASAVAQLRLDADLVILSACNSAGPGGQSAGESLSGLARGFFYAGARSLMVTHWSVNDQAAALLVSDTLRRLRSGADGGVAGALRAAELGMVDAAGKTMPADVAHPFFWAPFALIGDGSGRLVAAAL